MRLPLPILLGFLALSLSAWASYQVTQTQELSQELALSIFETGYVCGQKNLPYKEWEDKIRNLYQ